MPRKCAMIDKLHLQWKRMVRLFVSQGQKKVTFLLAPV